MSKAAPVLSYQKYLELLSDKKDILIIIHNEDEPVDCPEGLEVEHVALPSPVFNEVGAQRLEYVESFGDKINVWSHDLRSDAILTRTTLTSIAPSDRIDGGMGYSGISVTSTGQTLDLMAHTDITRRQYVNLILAAMVMGVAAYLLQMQMGFLSYVAVGVMAVGLFRLFEANKRFEELRSSIWVPKKTLRTVMKLIKHRL